MFLKDGYSIKGHTSGWPGGQWEDLVCYCQTEIVQKTQIWHLYRKYRKKKFICLIPVHFLLQKHQTAHPCPCQLDSGIKLALAFTLNVKGHRPEKLPCFFPRWSILVIYFIALDLWCLALTSHPTDMRSHWWLSHLYYRHWPFLQDPIKYLYKSWK